MDEVESLNVNLLFDDGVVTVNVIPPDNLTEIEFNAWCEGANSGIQAYLQATQKDRNFKKSKPIHKHQFKFVEASDDNTILYFYCIKCNDSGMANRDAFTKELLGWGE